MFTTRISSNYIPLDGFTAIQPLQTVTTSSSKMFACEDNSNTPCIGTFASPTSTSMVKTIGRTCRTGVGANVARCMCLASAGYVTVRSTSVVHRENSCTCMFDIHGVNKRLKRNRVAQWTMLLHCVNMKDKIEEKHEGGNSVDGGPPKM